MDIHKNNAILNSIRRFFSKEDNSNEKSIIFLRVTTGIFLLLQLFSIWRDFQKLHGKYGIIPYDVQGYITSDYVITLSKIITVLEPFNISEYTTIIIFITVFILFVLCLILGFFTRISALIVLILYVATSSGAYKYGVDSFVTTTLFYLFLFPSSANYSLDSLIFKKTYSKTNLVLYRRLLQINLCMVYFFSGITKAVGDTWWNGEAIWKSINVGSANKLFNFDFSWLAEQHSVLMVLGWSVLIIEILYPIFIWMPKTRKFWLTITILMHVGIVLVLNLFFFGVFMIIWGMAAFYFIKEEEEEKLVLA